MLTTRVVLALVLGAPGAEALAGTSGLSGTIGLVPWEEFAPAGKSAQATEVSAVASPGSRTSAKSIKTSSAAYLAQASIFAVAWTYFIHYFLLACVRSKNQYHYPDLLPSPNEKIFDQVGTYVVYVGPMLCVLFLEEVQRFDVPPAWLMCAIIACSSAFFLQTLAYICSELYVKRLNPSNLSAEQRRVVSMVGFWSNIRNFSALLQYSAVALIIYFGFKLGNVALPAGNKCTLILSTSYMVVYLLLFTLRTYRSEIYEFEIEVLKHASISINLAPMLCALCMGTQLAYEWDGFDLPPSVTAWMLISTYSVVVQVLLVSSAPYVAGAELRVVGDNGVKDFVSQSKVFILFSFLRSVALITLLVGVFFLCNALWAASPPTALKVSLYYFSCAYLFSYLVLLFTMFTEGAAHPAMPVLKQIKDTVAFCPMLCILFLAVFVQAKHLGGTATPQAYSLNSMLVATAGVFVQVAMICAADSAGKGSGWKRTFRVGFHVALMATFASVAVVAFGTLTIRA